MNRQRLAALLRLDITVQARSHLYSVGLVVAVALGLLLRALVPAESSGPGLAAFYVVGLGGTTMMFSAAMLLRERSADTLRVLQVTPVAPSEYLAAKVLSLTAFAGLESAVVYAIAARGVATAPGPLILGVVTLGLLYTLVGIGLAAPHRAITRFLLPSGTLAGLLLQLPVLLVLGGVFGGALGEALGALLWPYMIPSAAPSLLLLAAFKPLSPAQWAYTAVTLSLSLPVAWVWCLHRLRRHAGLGGLQ